MTTAMVWQTVLCLLKPDSNEFEAIRANLRSYRKGDINSVINKLQ